jgi:hypothetical protein
MSGHVPPGGADPASSPAVRGSDERAGRDRLALTLFVRPDDEASARAREELQVVMAGMPGHVSVEVCEVGDPETSRMGLSMAPILRIQIGEHTPEWVVRIERRSLARRLLDLGVVLSD